MATAEPVVNRATDFDIFDADHVADPYATRSDDITWAGGQVRGPRSVPVVVS